jgi:hypothetical protein
VDALLHLVRCFDDPNVVHVDGSVNPRRDIEVVEAELLLRDLDTVERRMEDARRRAKSGDKKVRAEEEFYERLRAHLLTGRLVRYFTAPEGEAREWMRSLHLLTDKPVMYVCNTPESDIAERNAYVAAVRAIADKEGAPVVTVSARLEEELIQLPAEDRPGFLRDLGIPETGLDRIVHEGYALLHLITFFTVGAKEVHARTLRRGQTAVEAAGVVHSDFARGFIRADIIQSEDVIRLGSEHAVREHGLLRAEGRDYVVQDGDVVYVRFNV